MFVSRNFIRCQFFFQSRRFANNKLETFMKALFATVPLSFQIRKTFFTLAFCDSCRKLLFQGFR